MGADEKTKIEEAVALVVGAGGKIREDSISINGLVHKDGLMLACEDGQLIHFEQDGVWYYAIQPGETETE